jgi:hypothetical protein
MGNTLINEAEQKPCHGSRIRLTRETPDYDRGAAHGCAVNREHVPVRDVVLRSAA